MERPGPGLPCWPAFMQGHCPSQCLQCTQFAAQLIPQSCQAAHHVAIYTPTANSLSL